MPLSRRRFVGTSIAGAAGAVVAPAAAARLLGASRGSEPLLRKAVKLSMVEGPATLFDKFMLLKNLGFEGVELESPNTFPLEEVLGARDSSGLSIHGVVDSQHWESTLSDGDEAVRRRGQHALEAALQDAHDYGASTVLLVPAVVRKHVPYDAAWQRSQAAIRQTLPLAEELGVRVAIENVWNGFLMSPMEMVRYIDELDSPWVGAYFDVGNAVNFGWPEHWIPILGHRVLKLDVKEYSRSLRDEHGPWAGFEVEIGDGDCDWPAVRAALTEIEYAGWATAEVPGGGADRLADISRRMDEHVVN